MKLEKFFAVGRRAPGAKAGGAWLATPWFWVGVMILAFGVPLYRSFTVPRPEPLPVYGRIDAFTVPDQDGKPFSSLYELRGAVTILQVVSTADDDKDTPKALEDMVRFQNRVVGVGNSVRLITWGADPVRDTPARLRELGLRATARFRQWAFLSGPLPQALAALKPGPRDFFLIDQLGTIRRHGSLGEASPQNKESNFWIRDLAYLVNAYSQE